MPIHLYFVYIHSLHYPMLYLCLTHRNYFDPFQHNNRSIDLFHLLRNEVLVRILEIGGFLDTEIGALRPAVASRVA